MKLQKSGEAGVPARAVFDSCRAAGPWLPTLFASSVVGVAVLDSGMRFRVINRALATMNGMPAHRHIGKRIRHVLGAAAKQVEDATDCVIQTREPASMELTAQLPLRTTVGHWLESFLPIPDATGRVTQVAAIILEISEKRTLQEALHQIVRNLDSIVASLKNELGFHHAELNGSNRRYTALAGAAELAEQCSTEAQALLGVAQLEPAIDMPLPLARKGVSYADKLTPRQHAMLRLLGNGKSNKEVAAALGISVRTEEAYRAQLMERLDLHSLAALVRFAVRNKIVEP